jgi:hypothetical protein
VRPMQGKIIIVEAAPSDTIATLHRMIEEQDAAVKMSEHFLIYAGRKLLTLTRTLKDEGIANESTIHLLPIRSKSRNVESDQTPQPSGGL